MKFKLFALVVTMALCASAVVKDSGEPNRFAAYNEAMKPEWGNPMAVEWQDANRSLIAAETSEAVIAVRCGVGQRASFPSARCVRRGSRDADADCRCFPMGDGA